VEIPNKMKKILKSPLSTTGSSVIGFAVCATILFIVAGIPMPVTAQAPGTNPAWSFQSNNYGRDSSGEYSVGVAQISYVATMTSAGEVYSVQYPQSTARLFLSTEEGNGSFVVRPEDGNGSAYVINKFLPASNNQAATTPAKMHAKDWQYGFQNRDGTSSVIGADVEYEYIGGTFPGGYSTDLLAMWLGFNTNTGYFLQVTAAWGYVCFLQWADGAPIFSIGYGGSTSNCPVGQSVQGHQYTMQIAFDNKVTGEWYFLIYDDTSQSYVLSPDYISGATGTYIPLNNLGLFMEGSSPSVDGTYIPNLIQGFYSFQYWTVYGVYYYWTHTPQVYHTSDTPSNVVGGYSWGGSPTHITNAGWQCSCLH
jgi:hypothetical protein